MNGARGFGIDIGGSGIKGCPVDLQAGGPERPLVLVLSNDQSITGTVVDGAGRPVGEAQVVVAPAPRSPAWAQGESDLRRNLRFLSTKAFTKGFYYDPRVDKPLLREHIEGLIALTACMAGAAALGWRTAASRPG